MVRPIRAIYERGQLRLIDPPELAEGAQVQIAVLAVGRGQEDSQTTTDQRLLAARGDALYERFGRSLESDHCGEYAAISEQGEIILGADLLDVMQRADKSFGPGGFIYKIGQREPER